MSSGELRTGFPDLVVGSPALAEGQTDSSGDLSSEGGLQVTCFTEDLHDVILHFQIVRFAKQVSKKAAIEVLKLEVFQILHVS